MNKLLKPKEVADILGVDEGTLTVWRSTGRVRLKFVKVGRIVMYKPEDVKQFIDDNTVYPDQERKNKPKGDNLDYGDEFEVDDINDALDGIDLLN